VEILEAPNLGGGSQQWLQLTLDPIGPDWIQGLLDDVTVHREAMVAAETLAHRDPLTGAHNRLGGERALAERIARNSGGLGLMLLDLDLFKQINDTLGHDAGDEVLRQVTTRVGSVLRRSDTVARLGGDEFLLIIDTLESTEAALGIGQKLLQAITEPMQLPRGRSAQVGVSVGITLCGGDEVLSIAMMIKQADIAMYQAKQSGGNCCRVYEPGSNPRD
jgi:diguanylate cyclase (GGDEF)-like protein